MGTNSHQSTSLDSRYVLNPYVSFANSLLILNSFGLINSYSSIPLCFFGFFLTALYYPVFYVVTSFVQSLTVEQTIQRAKDTFVPLMKRNLQFWIPVQFAVFGFVDEDLQIPILIVAGLVWTVILSVLAGSVSSSSETEEPAVAAAAAMDDFGVEETMLQVEFDGTSSSTTSFFPNATSPEAEMVDEDVVDVAVDVSQIQSKDVLMYSEEPAMATATTALLNATHEQTTTQSRW
jgi:Mpv17 / PMP22 family